MKDASPDVTPAIQHSSGETNCSSTAASKDTCERCVEMCCHRFPPSTVRYRDPNSGAGILKDKDVGNHITLDESLRVPAANLMRVETAGREQG